MADDSPQADPHDPSLDPDESIDSDRLPDDPIDPDAVARIAEEEHLAAARVSAIEAGRRKGGVAGAAMAGAMLAMRDIVEGPKRDDGVAVAESPDEPGDIDVDGITVDVEGHEFWAPPPGGFDDER